MLRSETTTREEQFGFMPLRATTDAILAASPGRKALGEEGTAHHLRLFGVDVGGLVISGERFLLTKLTKCSADKHVVRSMHSNRYFPIDRRVGK